MLDKNLFYGIDYFNSKRGENIFDALTHAVKREYILEFTKQLIESNKPFSAIKVNIDNFKLINENFGQHLGDILLYQLADILHKHLENNGVIGRVGGDEFLLILFGENTYDSNWAMLKDLFDHKLRTSFVVSQELNLRMTCTAGAAVFPTDAKTFDDLMLCLDKTIYRGKKKGRNCFICYVDEKHKDIDPSKKDLDALLDDIGEIHEILTSNKDFNKKTICALDYICNTLSLNGGYYFEDGKMVVKGSLSNEISEELLEDLKKYIAPNGLLVCNDYSDFKNKDSVVHNYLWENKIYSFVLCEVKYSNNLYGYVLFINSIIKRVWQESDKVLISFAAKSISYLKNK